MTTVLEATKTRPRGRARWEDALDAQLRAYEFTGSDRGRRFLKAWGWSASAKSERYADVIEQGVAHIRDAIFKAEPVHVDPDMQTLWEASVAGFDEEALRPEDLLTDIGFVYLPRPHEMQDVHGKRITSRAYAWHPVTFATETERPMGLGVDVVKDPGVVLYALHQLGDVDDYDDGQGVQVPKVMRRQAEAEGQDFDWATAGLKRGDLIVDHVMPWVFGEPRPALDTTTGTPLTHDVQALLRLLQQTITTRTQGRPERRLRRRMARADFPARSIVIVRLRRPSAPVDDDAEPRPVEWSHRWLVSGHWRWQPYPSLGPGVRKQIYISPFIKGPADKPLEVRKARIFDWSR